MNTLMVIVDKKPEVVNSSDAAIDKYIAKRLQYGLNQYHTTKDYQGREFSMGFKIQAGELERMVYDKRLLSMDLMITFGTWSDNQEEVLHTGYIKDIIKDYIIPKLIKVKHLNIDHVIVNCMDIRVNAPKRYKQYSFSTIYNQL